jgi:hypothetical protein
VALYGIDRLLEAKRAEREQIDDMWPTDEIIRSREELSEQMRALKDLASMAALYDCDISKPVSGSCVRPIMTRCSAAIPIGRPNASAAWIWMDAPPGEIVPRSC